MKKTKFQMFKIIKYLRELSVIIIGIAVTVLTGLWINDRNNTQDIGLYLENIKMELQNNLDDINMVKKYYDYASIYSNYLLTHKMQNLEHDTLSFYNGLTKALPFFTYKTSAFDMLKSSGMMRLIKDKSKVKAIWDCYDQLEFLKMTNDFYIQRKVTVLENYNGFAKGDVDQKLLFGFYTNGLIESLETYFSTYSKYIEETITKL